MDVEKITSREIMSTVEAEEKGLKRAMRTFVGPKYATTFLTQLEVLSGREWKILRRCVGQARVLVRFG